MIGSSRRASRKAVHINTFTGSPGGRPVVEIGDTEPAARRSAAVSGQRTGLVHGHRRDVVAPHGHPAPAQPYRGRSASARQVQRPPCARESTRHAARKPLADRPRRASPARAVRTGDPTGDDRRRTRPPSYDLASPSRAAGCGQPYAGSAADGADADRAAPLTTGIEDLTPLNDLDMPGPGQLAGELSRVGHQRAPVVPADGARRIRRADTAARSAPFGQRSDRRGEPIAGRTGAERRARGVGSRSVARGGPDQFGVHLPSHTLQLARWPALDVGSATPQDA